MDAEGSLKALSFGDPFLYRWESGVRGAARRILARMRAENFFCEDFYFFEKSSLQIGNYGLIYRKVVKSCKKWQEVE